MPTEHHSILTKYRLSTRLSHQYIQATNLLGSQYFRQPGILGSQYSKQPGILSSQYSRQQASQAIMTKRLFFATRKIQTRGQTPQKSGAKCRNLDYANFLRNFNNVRVLHFSLNKIIICTQK